MKRTDKTKPSEVALIKVIEIDVHCFISGIATMQSCAVCAFPI